MIPLSIYIHLPWCIQKCPYCDFNSHKAPSSIPEQAYTKALIQDFMTHLPLLKNRPLKSIFFGGGTPSLFSARSLDQVLLTIDQHIGIQKSTEITLEANPGTVEQQRFSGYRHIGINRLSLGIQSFNQKHLQSLGRIHDAEQACKAIETTINAGFTNYNLDVMHGLPNQTEEEGLDDLKTAIRYDPPHISWYQLTIEPNTLFDYQPPSLPSENILEDIQTKGQDFLHHHQYKNYEVSAYSKNNLPCQHNLNYWEFGDYLGIGAGAHSKITHPDGKVTRHWQNKHPQKYLLESNYFLKNQRVLLKHDKIFEFMLNALRLSDGFSFDLFEARTNILKSQLQKPLEIALNKGLLTVTDKILKPTILGRRFLNDLVGLFLE